ncbi:MAG: hypothetical protein IKJ16_06735 [Agathobacter sp.]|nr:hypothetical protein [Agathobacter sp.]
MSEVKKKGFKTLETDYEELDEQILKHRKQIFKRVLQIILVIAVIVIAIELMNALRSFDDYEVKNALDRSSSSTTQYQTFGDCLIEYSNDGATCIGKNKDIIWNQSFEMVSPDVQICGEYLVVYDAAGTKIFILTESGLEKSLEMTAPIQTVCIANQGTIAVLMKENQESQVKLFDKKGNELANGKFYGDKGGFPIDIALSFDGTKLAVDMVDVTQGKVKTTISFYNFGSVGQSEIDNNVGSYIFEGVLVPKIDYVSKSRMIGMGTGKLLVFDGAQKPELSEEIDIKEEVRSFFYNEKYIGIVYDNVEIDNSWHIKVMDMRGKTVMENETSLAYDNIEFLSGNEICVTNATQCEIFTRHSIKKFFYEFDKELYKVFGSGDGQNYTFIFKDTIEEVKLR